MSHEYDDINPYVIIAELARKIDETERLLDMANDNATNNALLIRQGHIIQELETEAHRMRSEIDDLKRQLRDNSANTTASPVLVCSNAVSTIQAWSRGAFMASTATSDTFIVPVLPGHAYLLDRYPPATPVYILYDCDEALRQKVKERFLHWVQIMPIMGV
jgi:hypothetical protein